jgi:sRNA-binding regulator protein Hfq
MRRIIFSVFILFLVWGKINAQSLQEIVYLKNGSTIKGIVIEQIPNQSIKLQTSDGSIFVYKMDEIEKISKEKTSKSDNSQRPSVTYDLNGYRGFVDVGYVFGTGDESSKIDRIEFSTTHGYQINTNFFVGGGTGIHYMTLNDVFLLPLFIDFKGYILSGNVSPYFDFKGGYTHILSKLEDEDIKGGLYISPAIGVRYLISNNIGLNASLGFVFQQFRDIALNEYAKANGVSFKFGIEF